MRLAEAAQAHYGFDDFKLKGGVLGGRARRWRPSTRSPSDFPTRASRSTRTARGRCKRQFALCKGKQDVLAYAEDPCGAEQGFSGREIMAEFRQATESAHRDQHDCDRLACSCGTQFNCMRSTFRLPIRTSGRCRVRCAWRRCAATTGSRGARTRTTTSTFHWPWSRMWLLRLRATITAIDTHWIWQDGQHLTRNPLQIVDGRIEVPERPGLGVDLDLDAD